MRQTILILTVFLLASTALSAGDDIQIITDFIGDDFEEFSRELGVMLMHTPVTTAESLGIIGFDLSLSGTGADIDEDSSRWQTAAGGQTFPSTLGFGRLNARKGFPRHIDLEGSYSTVPGSNVEYWSAGVKWRFFGGGALKPAVALRASYSTLEGVDTLDLETQTVELLVSKGFAMITPYGGIGQVFIQAEAKNLPFTPSQPLDLDDSETVVYGGLRVSLKPFSIAGQIQTGPVTTYSLRLGLQF